MTHGVNFADVERNFVRARVYPDFEWRAYDAFSPLNPLRVPLQSARVAFVTTSGAHLMDQAAFDIKSAAGDPSFRAFPISTPLDQMRLSHRGYDTRRASVDKNVVLPLDHLRAAAADGRIGGLSPTVYSFMGYIAETEVLLEQSAPRVAASLASDGADLVLLAPTWPVCQQSVGLIQRVLDEAGLCTISITQVVEITAITKPSRAMFVAHPFGLTFGALDDANTQRAVIDALLSAAVNMDAPGIRDSGLRWTGDDLRTRQLRKQAH